jgi:hypothetical protein
MGSTNVLPETTELERPSPLASTGSPLANRDVLIQFERQMTVLHKRIDGIEGTMHTLTQTMQQHSAHANRNTQTNLDVLNRLQTISAKVTDASREIEEVLRRLGNRVGINKFTLLFALLNLFAWVYLYNAPGGAAFLQQTLQELPLRISSLF